MGKSRSKPAKGSSGAQQQSKSSRRALRWLAVVGGIVVVAVMLSGGALAAATQMENHDAFCASCHTQPETQYYQRSVDAPVDLASAHAAKHVDCIQCHSGPGTTGRLLAISSVAAPDLVHYLAKTYHDPAVVTVPIGDDHCLKCHGDISDNRNFNNHFHAFLPQWQQLAPDSAATCVDCHQAHVTGGRTDIAFLDEATTSTVCERCHAVAGRD